MDHQKVILACLCLILTCYAMPNTNKEARFSIFQITKFANAPCKGSGTKNGTCYTEQECSDIGGTKSGKCADGFGVCCVKEINSGEGSSINGSYITNSAPVAGVSNSYSVCPMNSEICRIRFDFTDFVLAAPVTAPGTLATGNAGLLAVQAPSIGACTTDTFYIRSGTGRNTPTICGTNIGQHMIVDSDGVNCAEVNFNIGGATATRSWDIQVTQYECGDEMGGPAGCLQYFTTEKGTIRSFNFPVVAAGTAIEASVVHLQNQNYKACIRKPAGKTAICYPPCTSVDPTTGQSSYGIGPSPVAAAQSASGTDCVADYIEIQGGQTNANAVAADLRISIVNRWCGRELLPMRAQAWAAAITATTGVCTNVVPFELAVHFNDNEVIANTGDAMTAEAGVNPGGIIGFSLCYETLAQA